MKTFRVLVKNNEFMTIEADDFELFLDKLFFFKKILLNDSEEKNYFLTIKEWIYVERVDQGV